MKKLHKQKLNMLKSQIEKAMELLFMKCHIDRVKVRSFQVIDFKIRLLNDYEFDDESFEKIMNEIDKQTNWCSYFGKFYNKKSPVVFNITLMDDVLDIRSNLWKPSNLLSNFYTNDFIFDGVPCKSMEGFLQSLKFKNKNEQKEVCLLKGKDAKEKGKKKFLWKLTGNVHWNGTTIKRNSKEFDDLIMRAYEELYKQSSCFKLGLLNSKNYKLVHTIGKHNKHRTILTEQEFIACLDKLRKNHFNI